MQHKSLIPARIQSLFVILSYYLIPLLTIFKIAIPLIIIVIGMFDLGKAVVAAKDDEIKKATKSLAMRAISGVIIFFVPTLVGFIFTLVDGFSGDVSADYEVCKTCIVSPTKCPAQK